jgi:cytochrome c oxidase cbb3-type subunit 3
VRENWSEAMKPNQNRRILSRRGSLRLAAAVGVCLTVIPAWGQRGGPLPPPEDPFHGNQQAVLDGREIYNNSCTACHGRDGTAGDRALALGAPARRYMHRTDRQIFDAIIKGIPGTQMPPTGLNETDAWKVTAYILALRGTAIDAPAGGDVAQGEKVFWGKGECGQCHMIRGRGGLIGPDLSNLAGIRKLSSIIDALTKEQHRVPTDGGTHDAMLTPLMTYQPVRITFQDGKQVTGVLRNEDTFSLQVLGLDNNLYLLERDRLKEVFYIPKSFMPTDYDKRLTKVEFQDLLAFLSRQAILAPQMPARPGRPAGE